MYSLDDFTYLFTRKDLDTLNALRSKNKKDNGWLGANQLKEAIYNFIVFFKMGMISPARRFFSNWTVNNVKLES